MFETILPTVQEQFEALTRPRLPHDILEEELLFYTTAKDHRMFQVGKSEIIVEMYTPDTLFPGANNSKLENKHRLFLLAERICTKLNLHSIHIPRSALQSVEINGKSHLMCTWFATPLSKESSYNNITPLAVKHLATFICEARLSQLSPHVCVLGANGQITIGNIEVVDQGAPTLALSDLETLTEGKFTDTIRRVAACYGFTPRENGTTTDYDHEPRGRNEVPKSRTACPALRKTHNVAKYGKSTTF